MCRKERRKSWRSLLPVGSGDGSTAVESVPLREHGTRKGVRQAKESTSTGRWVGIKIAITIMLQGIHWHELDAVRDDEAIGIFVGNGDSSLAPSGQSEFAERKEAFVAGVALVYFDRP